MSYDSTGPDISKIFQDQKSWFEEGHTLPLEARRQALHQLKKGLTVWEDRLMEAVRQDLRKSPFEAYTNELGVLHAEITHTLKHLKSWTTPKKVRPELYLMPARGEIHPHPLGPSLIIAPWNYPIQLLFAPLIAALAAGNTAVLKPSELSVHSEKVLTAMVREIFDPRLVAIHTGGPEVTTALLALPFPKIFFTGSPGVGKIVMKAAAENLASVTLELGGKSPALVDETTDLRIAARKIAWGKFNNAGQTCVAPDYVLVHRSVQDRFVAEVIQVLKEFHGEEPKSSPWYGRVINRRHFDRLSGYLTQGKILHGGQTDPGDLYISPTLILPQSWELPVMEEEIFGPILPVLPFETPEEAVALVKKRPNPLALYIFSGRKRTQELWRDSLNFGGGGIHATVLQVASSRLPFGGIGTSGIGSYHGKAGFDAFTHYKSILVQSSRFDPGLNYPPRTVPLKLVKGLMK